MKINAISQGYISIGLFLVFTTVAMIMYPGGTIHNSSTEGYQFFYNFFSNLGEWTARNGEPNKISAYLKINIEPLIRVEEMLTPIDVQNRTGSYNGSLYGENQNSFAAIFNRKKNQDKKLKKLYYVGGTVRPGGGIPLAAKSGYNTAKLIIKNES